MNKYDVLGVVGEGAYGVVLKCKNKDTNEVVAIKKFKESEEDEVVRKTTLREVKILRIMRHENIVQLREAFRRKGKLYLVFEFVEKSMLDILEANPNGVDLDTVRVLTCQLGRAIEYCHRHDVIHRDIKPENLLINPSDNALRLCDFGFARTMTADSPLTDYVATRWYRAPELLLGSTHYGKDVDIWALGCIMGELTDGQPLFAGESEVDQLFVIQKVLGPLTPEHMEMFLRNPRFLGIQFPDVSRPETLERRYSRRMPKLQMQLLKGVLVMEPRRRHSAKDVLRMPWFEGVKLPRSLRPPSQSQSRTRPESSSSVAPSVPGSTTTQASPAPRGQQTETAAPQREPPHRESLQQASGPWHEQLLEQSEPRGPREDPRQMAREDLRGHSREEQPSLHQAHQGHQSHPGHQGHFHLQQARGAHTSSATQPHSRHDEIRSMPSRDDLRGSRVEDPRMANQDPRLMFEDHRSMHDPRTMGLVQPQHHHLSPQGHQHHGRSHPYVLPWEDSMPEEGPPMDYTSTSAYGESEDKVNGDGRRSRQHRRSVVDSVGLGGQGDWCDGRSQGGDRGTPNNADRGGTSFGFGGGVGQGPCATGSSNTAAKASRSMVANGPSIGFGAGMLGGGVSSASVFGVPTPVAGPGTSSTTGGVGSTGSSAAIHGGGGGGNGGGSGGLGEGVAGGTRHAVGSSTAGHRVSAGTGGSEEWPSTQSKAARSMREPEYEEEKALWAQQGLPRRKAGRQPGGLGGVPAPPTRRSPDLEPWQQEPRAHEAWRGDGPSLHGGGLPSVHGGFLSGPQGVGLGEGSRAPPRLSAGTPTPRDEDSLDFAARQLHFSGGRWGGSSVSTSAANAGGDWPGLGPSPAELGPVRDARGPLHEARTPQHQHDSRSALGGLRARPDLSSYHGH
mmetsp:Transcript_49152/g.137658  ORF Transcript_49152/g.137658 Transcript_49152/m.137658 type:complete len:900 (-) Transcript_49152:111-2810(-)